MSTDYNVYTEVKYKDKWHLASPRYRNIEKNEDNIISTYWSGSRYYFQDTYEKIRDLGTSILYTELSDELQKELSWVLEDIEGNPKDANDTYLLSLDFARMRLFANKRTKEYGLVNKNEIVMIENGEIEEPDDWIYGYADWEELDDEVKKLYAYYEWDDPRGWAQGFKTLIERISIDIDRWCDNNYTYSDNIQARIVVTVA